MPAHHDSRAPDERASSLGQAPLDAAQRRDVLRRAETLLDELPRAIRGQRRVVAEEILWDLGDGLRAVKAWLANPPKTDAEYRRLQAVADELDALVESYLPRRGTHFLAEVGGSLALAVGIALIARAFLFEAFQIPTGSMLPTLRVGDRIFVTKFVYGVTLPFGWGRVFEWRTPARGEVIIFRFPWGGVHDGKHFIKRVVGVPGDVVQLQANDVLVNEERLTVEGAPPEAGACEVEPGDVCTRRYTADSVAEALASGRQRPGCECILQAEVAGPISWVSQHVAPGSACECQRSTASAGDSALSCAPMQRRVVESPRSVLNEPSWPPRFRSRRLLDGWPGAESRGPMRVPSGHVLVMGDNRDFSEDGRIWGLVPYENIEGKAWFVWYSEAQVLERVFETVH